MTLVLTLAALLLSGAFAVAAFILSDASDAEDGTELHS